jgi:hypothetical protein
LLEKRSTNLVPDSVSVRTYKPESALFYGEGGIRGVITIVTTYGLWAWRHGRKSKAGLRWTTITKGRLLYIADWQLSSGRWLKDVMRQPFNREGSKPMVRWRGGSIFIFDKSDLFHALQIGRGQSTGKVEVEFL